MPGLTFASQSLPGVTVISVAGEVDATNARQLDAYLRQSGHLPGEHVVIDLSEVRFLSSAGLRVLLNTHAFARQHGGCLHLGAPHPVLVRILETTQAQSVLRVHVTVEQAVVAALTEAQVSRLRPRQEVGAEVARTTGTPA
ncbi:MAG: STAS domain-containing protein [Nonomuraea sp.]|nr:STAS domain-containing protein [Nonomuraea sp.]NUP81274.1 STAS domain-containing protein [Nonomuraea sp.]